MAACVSFIRCFDYNGIMLEENARTGGTQFETDLDY
jgi:hypothetical protein